VSEARSIAIFPALVCRQTVFFCERRLFLIAAYLGGVPALYGGLFAQRLWMIGLGVLIFVGLTYAFAEMTKHDPYCREAIVNTTYYKDRYLAVGRWDLNPKVRR
jgi:type IV secretory pathway TrbD component